MSKHKPVRPAAPLVVEQIGTGGELHQNAGGSHPPMTTNQGGVIADDENSLKLGQRGPVLLEDFALLEKLTHFNHERIPERVVHARGAAAHGFFELTDSLGEFTKAKVLGRGRYQNPAVHPLFDGGR